MFEINNKGKICLNCNSKNCKCKVKNEIECGNCSICQKKIFDDLEAGYFHLPCSMKET